jgi:hypothetical protein
MVPAMIIAGAFVTALVSAPWTTLTGVLVTYLATIPFSYRAYQRRIAEDGGENVTLNDG